jgi:DNA-directed RNA polymerase subunit RPC12/RpoP
MSGSFPHPPPGHVLDCDASLLMCLRLEGYAPGPPPHITAETQMIDSQCAGSTRCPRCGQRGLAYEPWHRGGSYRAIARCTRCGSTFEM